MTITASHQATIDRHEHNLLSGERFRLIARSNRSVPLGGPPMRSASYGQMIATLGKFAAQGDWHTAAVRNAIGRLNPYLTINEGVAQVAEAVSMFVADGYFDVVGATGPEASRPSAHQRSVTLPQALLLDMLMTEIDEAAGWTGSVPGIGWTTKALMEREGVTFPRHLFPIHDARREARASA